MEKKIKIKGIVDRNKYLYDNKVYGGGTSPTLTTMDGGNSKPKVIKRWQKRKKTS